MTYFKEMPIFVVADEQKIIEHHNVMFFNPDEGSNTTYIGKYYDKNSLMEFVYKEMGITSGIQQVNRNIVQGYGLSSLYFHIGHYIT